MPKRARGAGRLERACNLLVATVLHATERVHAAISTTFKPAFTGNREALQLIEAIVGEDLRMCVGLDTALLH